MSTTTAQAPEWATSSVLLDSGHLYYGPTFGYLQVSQEHATGTPSGPVSVSTGDTLAFTDPAQLQNLAADALAATEWVEVNR